MRPSLGHEYRDALRARRAQETADAKRSVEATWSYVQAHPPPLDDRSAAELLAAIRGAAWDGPCADALVDLVAALGPGGAPDDLYELALRRTQKNPDHHQRQRDLNRLAQVLPAAFVPEAVAISAIHSDLYYDALALAGPAHLLPDDERDELVSAALAMARKITYLSNRAQALAYIADRDAAIFDEALATVCELRGEHVRGEMLAEDLAPVARDEHFPRIISTISAMADEFYRKEALTALPRLPASAARAALRLALDFQDDIYRCDTVESFVPFLPESLLSEVMLEILTWSNARLQERVLTAVATHAPATLEDDVRYVISELRPSERRTAPLAALTRSTDDAAEEALNALTVPPYTGYPAREVTRLAPSLPGRLLLRAIALAGTGEVGAVQAVLARALDVDRDIALAVFRSVLASATATELQVMAGRLATVADHLGGVDDVRAIVAAVREDQDGGSRDG